MRKKQHIPAYDCDFLVVGAGPAGSAVSRHLSEKGYKVFLADKEKFPREKVCGDFLSPVSLQELENLGIADQPEFQKTHVVRSAGIYLNGDHLITGNIPKVRGFPSYGRVIPRSHLDHWLLLAAKRSGAKILEGYRAESYTVSPQGVTVRFRYKKVIRNITARALVGADGSNSVIARILRGYRVPEKDRIIAIRAYFTGVEGLDDTAFLFFHQSDFPGYCWLFPTGPESANVGIGFLSETMPPVRRNLPASLTRRIQEDPALEQYLRNARMVGKPKGWPLSLYNPNHPITSDRVVLAGDAAGLANPLNGEGIQYALLSARWAAETLDKAAKKDDFSGAVLQEYAAKVEQELRSDMAVSRAIIQLIRNRSLNPLWMRSLRITASRASADPAYGDLAGGILCGLIHMSDLTNAEIIEKTLIEAAVSTGIEMAASLSNPCLFDDLSKEVTGAIGQMTFLNPVELSRWVLGVLDSSAELATQISFKGASKEKKG